MAVINFHPPVRNYFTKRLQCVNTLISQLRSGVLSPDVQHEDRSNEEQWHDEHRHRSADNTQH